ncbi:MAG: hypothetical protein LCI00_16160 [Chloroflexi bacterium]|nr:hypothetical protein [Chloroflexota bacterium]MCC6892766.1 hypothetical protein [Anaerolineae bacterium]
MKEIILKRIEAYLSSGDIQLGDVESSNKFNDYVSEAYPWIGSHIIWEQVRDIQRIDLLSSNHEIKKFINSSRLGSYSTVAMVYSASEECLFMSLPFLIENVEFLTTLVIFQCYFVGVRKTDDQYELICEDFVEYEFNSDYRLTGKTARI